MAAGAFSPPRRAQKLHHAASVSATVTSPHCNSSGTNLGDPYQRHQPEQTTLYRTLQEHWPTFVERLESESDGSAGLPRFITEEIEAFLRCGILAHGFLRVVCDQCHENRLVAFSCKRRGFCPSCIGRTMND